MAANGRVLNRFACWFPDWNSRDQEIASIFARRGAFQELLNTSERLKTSALSPRHVTEFFRAKQTLSSSGEYDLPVQCGFRVDATSLSRDKTSARKRIKHEKRHVKYYNVTDLYGISACIVTWQLLGHLIFFRLCRLVLLQLGFYTIWAMKRTGLLIIHELSRFFMQSCVASVKIVDKQIYLVVRVILPVRTTTVRIDKNVYLSMAYGLIKRGCDTAINGEN